MAEHLLGSHEPRGVEVLKNLDLDNKSTQIANNTSTLYLYHTAVAAVVSGGQMMTETIFVATYDLHVLIHLVPACPSFVCW